MPKTMIGLDDGEDITLDRLFVILSDKQDDEVIANAFEDHRGRPGLVGGSLPREAGTGPTPKQTRAVLQMLRENPDGFSYDPFDESSPTSGYMSSVHDGPIFDPELNDDEAMGYIEQFLADKQEMLAPADVYVGGWQNSEDSKFYLDISQNYTTEVDAMRSATSTRQKSIYFLDQRKVIWVSQWLNDNPHFEAPPGAREWYLKNPT